MTYKKHHIKVIQPVPDPARLRRLEIVLRCLLAFQTQDLSKFSQKERNDLSNVLQAFSSTPMGKGTSNIVAGINIKVDKKGFLKVGSSPFKPLTLTELKKVQQKFCWILDRVFPRSNNQNNETVEIPTVIHAVGLTQDFQKVYFADWPHTFWLATVDLVATFGSRLKRCAKCSIVFLVKNLKAGYCSEKCSRQARNQIYYLKRKKEINFKKKLRWAGVKATN